MAEGLRLNKALADAGVCARRKADELIFAGQITVNGQVADSPGIRVIPGKDIIGVQGREMKLAVPGRETCCLLLNKPVQVVSTVSDPQGRSTVLDYLPPQWRKLRLYPIGRLDYFSEGLILLTDDGNLAHAASHPSSHLAKVYRILLRQVPDEMLNKALVAMRSGMTLAEGDKLAPVKVTRQPDQNGKICLEMTLIQGVNRQIRRMFRDMNLTILRLERISQGPIKLGGLKPGQVRSLTAEELQKLCKQLQIKG